MSTNLFRRFFEGINLKSKTASSASTSGDLEVVNGKINFHNGTSAKPIITEHVVDVDLTGPFADDSTVPSSKVTKSYADGVATTASGNLSTHASLTTTHGVTGTLVGTSDSQTLTNKTIDSDNNTISNITVTQLKAGVLDVDLSTTSALDDTIPSAKAVKTGLDANTTALGNHISDATDAHNSTAITNTPANGIVATTTQDAVNELQTNALAHINSLTAHTAANLVNVPSGNLAATDIQSALNELQTDVDSRAQADKLVDTVTKIIDFADNSKVLKFDVAGSIATSTTLTTSQTIDRILTLPDSDGNIATEQFANDAAVKYAIVLG